MSQEFQPQLYIDYKGDLYMSKKQESNVVFIGSKPVMSYVLACITQLNEGNQDLILKARGRAISRAVDTAEIIRNRFVTDAKINDIKISTEQIQRSEGGTANVSAIEITISKKK
jgi:DNA-binding protein